MDDSTGRLLFTDEPQFDESFIGYIMRLAEMNEIPELQWLLNPAGLRRRYDYKYKFSSDLRVDPKILSRLTGTDEEKNKESAVPARKRADAKYYRESGCFRTPRTASFRGAGKAEDLSGLSERTKLLPENLGIITDYRLPAAPMPTD